MKISNHGQNVKDNHFRNLYTKSNNVMKGMVFFMATIFKFEHFEIKYCFDI